MIAKNSYLVMAGMFLVFAVFAQANNDPVAIAILVWSSVVFCFFWLLHFLKTACAADYGRILVRDSLSKHCTLTAVLFPFLLIKYCSLVMQSCSGEAAISRVTDKICIGQQLLWFHRKMFRDANIGAVLDVTVENRETFFIAGDKSLAYLRIPVLDKTSPSVAQLEAGVTWALEKMGEGRNLYVHCGAGHERSATFVCAILLRLRTCKSIDEAMAFIRQSRPKVRFVADQQAVLGKWLAEG